MKRKNKENCSRAERGSVKNKRLAVLGGLALGGLAYLLWPTYTPRWATAEPLQLQPSIEGRLPSNALFAGKERQAVSLDRNVEEDFLAQIKISEETKRRWQEMSGNPNANLVHSNARVQDCFIPEERQDIAEEYKEYVKHAFNHVYNALGKTDKIPLVFIPRKSFYEAPRSAAIVSDLLRFYKADFEISDGTQSLKIPSEAMIKDEDAFGSNSFEMDIVWGESVKFREAPMLLSFQGSVYERLQTPVAEILHGVIRPGTQTLLNKRITGKWPEDKRVFAEVVNDCMHLEEAVAHVVAYATIPSIASAYGLSVNEQERDAKRTFEHGLPRFKYLAAAEKLVDPKDPFKLIRDYVEDPETVAEKLGAKIR